MARPLGKLAPVHFTSSSFTVNTSPIKSTVFISWYRTCMLKLAFSFIKHGKRVIYYSLVPFWCFWAQSVYLSTEISKTEKHEGLAAGEHFLYCNFIHYIVPSVIYCSWSGNEWAGKGKWFEFHSLAFTGAMNQWSSQWGDNCILLYQPEWNKDISYV